MTVPEVELRIVKPEEIFQYWDQLSTSELTKRHSIKELAPQVGKVATGEYLAVGFFSGTELRGMVIFDTRKVQVNGAVESHAITKQIYAPYNARHFLVLFMDLLRKWGYSKIGGARAGDGKSVARLLGFRTVYTYIERDL